MAWTWAATICGVPRPCTAARRPSSRRALGNSAFCMHPLHWPHTAPQGAGVCAQAFAPKTSALPFSTATRLACAAGAQVLPGGRGRHHHYLQVRCMTAAFCSSALHWPACSQHPEGRMPGWLAKEPAGPYRGMLLLPQLRPDSEASAQRCLLQRTASQYGVLCWSDDCSYLGSL